MNESKKLDTKIFILQILRKKRIIKQARLIDEIRNNSKQLIGTAKNSISKYIKELISEKKISIIPCEAFKKYRIKDRIDATYYCLGEESDFNKYVTAVISALYDEKDVVFENAVNELINFKEIALESNELLDISNNLSKEIEKEIEENYDVEGKIEKRIVKTKEITSPFFCNKIVKLLKIQIDNNSINLKEEELNKIVENLTICFFRQGNLLNERYDLQFISIEADRISESISYKSELRHNIIYLISKLKPNYLIENIFLKDISNNINYINNISAFPTTKLFKEIDYDFKLEHNVWDNLKVINKLCEIIYLNYISNNLKEIFNSDSTKHQLFEYINNILSPKNLRNAISFINKIRLENGDSIEIK